MKIKPSILFVFFVVSGFADMNGQSLVRFAVIGDYGKWNTGGEALVSTMVHAWNPDFVITVGDNNYESGAAATIDSNIGQFYHDYLYPYYGSFGAGALENRFFSSLGNHDWVTAGAVPYLEYFTLPGNERYYDFVKGNCHLMALDSDGHEPDGNTSSSVQATWLRDKLALSTSTFKIVYFHHPPYSSGVHGNSATMQWPFEEWGATVVLCGHEHNYERLVSGGLTYVINGLGGKDWRDFDSIIAQSRFRFTGNFGAMLVTAYADSLNLGFYAVPNTLVDDTTLVPPLTGVASGVRQEAGFSLRPNYPNPFNPSTTIEFSLPHRGPVTLKIYNALGQKVTTIIDDVLGAGSHQRLWNSGSLPSGIYIGRLEFSGQTLSRRLLLMK